MERSERDEVAVLYVDDEEANRLVFRYAFGDEFYVICAGSGREALEVIESRPVGVVVADHRMPEMTGVDLFEIVQERYPEVIRILATAYSDHATTIEAINRGGVLHYLEKPWDPESVRRLLRDAVARARLDQTLRALRRAMVERERLSILAALRAGLLHDLAQPTAAIAACSASLDATFAEVSRLLSDASRAEIERDLGDLRAAAKHLSALYEKARYSSILDASRRKRQRLLDIVGSLRTLVRGDLPSHVKLTMICPEDAWVTADATDLSRILVNLVANAIQALDGGVGSGAEIRVVVVPHGDVTQIRISDTGPGIPPELTEHVFDLFATTRGERGSLGVGLAICRELAAANGGNVELVPGDGRGATFVVTLPAEGTRPGS